LRARADLNDRYDEAIVSSTNVVMAIVTPGHRHVGLRDPVLDEVAQHDEQDEIGGR
jgi:hypothetical protein